jgi:hypothetical protein
MREESASRDANFRRSYIQPKLDQAISAAAILIENSSSRWGLDGGKYGG